MRKQSLSAPDPVRGYVLPWRLDVLPPRNMARYRVKVSVHAVDAPSADTPAMTVGARTLVVVVADALGLSKGKTRKAIQAGKARVRGNDGIERQVFDPDYLLVSDEIARLDV